MDHRDGSLRQKAGMLAMRVNWLLWALVALALLFGLTALSMTLAQAQELPPHDPADKGHWYDHSCCSLKDCSPARSKVIPSQSGYIVTQLGEIVPYRDQKIRQSKDSDFHVCERQSEYKGSRIICLYVPPMSF